MAVRRKKATRQRTKRVVRRRAPVARFFKGPNIRKEIELMAVVGFALLFLYYAVL